MCKCEGEANNDYLGQYHVGCNWHDGDCHDSDCQCHKLPNQKEL